MVKHEFIIDLPYLKRWWLPSRKHQYQGQIKDKTYTWSVLDATTGKTIRTGEISLDHPGYQELVILSQQLAEEHYNIHWISDVKN